MRVDLSVRLWCLSRPLRTRRAKGPATVCVCAFALMSQGCMDGSGNSAQAEAVPHRHKIGDERGAEYKEERQRREGEM